MDRPVLPSYPISKSEHRRFNRLCHAWDLAQRATNNTVTENDVAKAYTVLSYVGRLAKLDYKNSINDNTQSLYNTPYHKNNLERAENARRKANQMLLPYQATIVYFGPMPTIVDINKTNQDLMVGHW